MKDLEKVKTIIRWQITRDPVLGIIKIDQSAVIKYLVIEDNLTNCNATDIPLKIGVATDMLNTNDYEKTKFHKYQWLIGKLIYLVYKTKPDIAFAIGQLSKHNANSRKNHLNIVKRVVLYLKSIILLSLMDEQIVIDPAPYGLIGYINSNFARDSAN